MKKIFNLDSQTLSTFQSCARKYKYSFLDQIKPLNKAEALEKGDLMHKMLEIYYSLQIEDFQFQTEVWKEIKLDGILPPSKRDFSSIQKFSVEVGRYYSTKMELSSEEIDETIFQFKEYTDYYQYDSWRPLAVEEVGSKSIYEDDDLLILYSFKIDLVAENGKTIAPFDHKTSKRREEPSSLSNQFIGYCFGLGLNNIVINKIGFQKTLKPKERFNRFILMISSERIEEWRKNTVWWAKRMIESLGEDYFSMTLTSCDKYSGCIYQNICESDPELRDQRISSYYQIGDTWDVAKGLEK